MVGIIAHSIRVTPQSASGFSPYQLVYGQDPLSPLALLWDPSPLVQHPDYKHIEKLLEDLEGMQGNFKIIHDKLVERREKQYNEKQSVDYLRPGELVLYWRRRIKKGFPTKLLIDW